MPQSVLVTGMVLWHTKLQKTSHKPQCQEWDLRWLHTTSITNQCMLILLSASKSSELNYKGILGFEFRADRFLLINYAKILTPMFTSTKISSYANIHGYSTVEFKGG